MPDPTVGDDAGATLAAPEVHRVIRRAVLVPLGAVALVCGLLGFEIRGLAQDYDRVVHTEQVMAEIHRALGLFIDHETALRAHLLAGDASFLAPYRDAERRLPGVLDVLQGEVADNPEQIVRVARLRDLYSTWKASADAAVDAPSVCALDDRSAPLLAMRRRKLEMDEIRAVATAMIDAERALLRDREARTATTTSAVFISAGVLGLLLVASLVVVCRRGLRAIERSYRHTLAERPASAEAEREARTAAEALAAEISAESRALEERHRALRAELEALRGRA